jgi:hypothetical protein
MTPNPPSVPPNGERAVSVFQALARRRPRLAAAVSFGAAGLAVAAAWFLPSVLGRRDLVALGLYVIAPAAAAALAGALAGGPLADATRPIGTPRALLQGAAVATLALLLFAPLFALLFTWTAPGTSIVGLTVAVLIFSALAVWWLVAAVGAAVGWLLHRVASGRRPA